MTTTFTRSHRFWLLAISLCAIGGVPSLMHAAEETPTPTEKPQSVQLAMEDESRLYDPFGVIKDGEMKAPERPKTISTDNTKVAVVEGTPFQDLVDRHVRILGVNAARETATIGTRSYQKGDTLIVKTGGTPLRCKVVSVSRNSVVLQDQESDEQATVSVGRTNPGIRRTGTR